jgi:hypothetical protein
VRDESQSTVRDSIRGSESTADRKSRTSIERNNGATALASPISTATCEVESGEAAKAGEARSAAHATSAR